VPPAAAESALPPPSLDEVRLPGYILPPPPKYPVPDDLWIGSPLLVRPDAAPPGWVFNAESSILWVHSSAHLVGGTAPNYNVGGPATGGLPITGDTVRFPGNAFNAGWSPRIELGYRFPDGFGELRLSYRSLAASGSDTVLVSPPDANDPLGLASQKGRFDLNVIDLDFAMQQFALGPNWEMWTAVGFRYASAYLDSQVNFHNPVTVTGDPYGTGPITRLSQFESVFNRYIGAHAVLEVGRRLWLPGLAFFLRLEGAGLYGRVHQTFKETFVEPPGFTQQRVTNGVGSPWLNGQVGLSYVVPEWNRARILIGYQYEALWQFGRGDNDLSFGSLKDQGVFLRFEFTY
jgi:hypothetical protein